MLRHLGLLLAAALAGCGGTHHVQQEASANIPKALQGKWALAPEDCTAVHGTARGMLTIGPTLVRFYESVAHLGRVEEVGDGRLLADFVFQGAGARWTRSEEFDALDNVLVRREYTSAGSSDPVSYTRCDR